MEATVPRSQTPRDTSPVPTTPHDTQRTAPTTHTPNATHKKNTHPSLYLRQSSRGELRSEERRVGKGSIFRWFHIPFIHKTHREWLCKGASAGTLGQHCGQGS